MVNPVADVAYGPEAVDAMLARHDCARITPRENWAPRVLDSYVREARRSSLPVADVRCPAARDLVIDLGLGDSLDVPDIDPILLCAARDACTRPELGDAPRVVLTPCRSLAEAGERLGLAHTTFAAWNEFIATLGEDLGPYDLGCSPIPPGFFSSTGLRVRSVTGPDALPAYLAASSFGGCDLIEMLLCADGCHNGDGMPPLSKEGVSL